MLADSIDRRDSGPYADKLQRLNEYQAALRLGYDVARSLGCQSDQLAERDRCTTIPKNRLCTTSDVEVPAADCSAAAEDDARNFVHRKDAYWVFNLRGYYNVNDRITVYGGVDNLLDKNQHPIFIAQDDQPYITDDTSLQRRPGQLDARALLLSPV